jgi:two-component system OmpR family response regulator
MELLVVENHRLFARILRTSLEEEGFAVRIVDDPAKAKALLAAETYDVVLLDLLPQNESAVLRDWRQARINTPVLFLSSPASSMEHLNDLGLGPGASLSKPFHFEDLLSWLRLLGDGGRERLDSFRSAALAAS